MFDNKQNIDLLSSRLNGLLGTSQVEYTQLPSNIRARVRALKNIQVEMNKGEVNYYKELHSLEMKYAKQNEQFYKKRNDIVSGRYEPRGNETEFKEDFEESEANQDTDHGARGIPSFWLTVFKNVEPLASMISPADEKILANLEDVRLTIKEKGFQLDFVFGKNEFFTNDVLTKTYDLEFAVNEEEPLDYSGPEIVGVKGTEINWTSEENNPTVSFVRKTQKAKNRSSVTKATTSERAESFFNFFSPPSVVPDDEDVDYELRMQVTQDYEAGDILRQTVIHDAVLFFTGDALLSDDESDEESYMDDESEESD
jgi:nucleosome assembly protein 1-like 1